MHVARQSESEYCAKSVGVVAAAAALHLVRKNQELGSPRKEVPRVKDYSSREGVEWYMTLCGTKLLSVHSFSAI